MSAVYPSSISGQLQIGRLYCIETERCSNQFCQVGNFERNWEGVGRRPVWGGGLLERDGEERCGEKPARPPPQFVIGKKSFLDSGLKLGFGIRGLVFRYVFFFRYLDGNFKMR